METKQRGKWDLPKVVIVGRVNAGKSSLFNRLIRKPLAVVDKKPGVTRDSLMKTVSWEGKLFNLIDTGGLFPEKEDLIWPEVKKHIEKTVEEADLVLFLVDLKAGLTPFDRELAIWLRKKGKYVILVANKADIKRSDPWVFLSLGFGEPLLISTAHGIGIGNLVEEVFKKLDEIEKPAPLGTLEKEEKIRVSLIGRPNVGKSSILNAFLGEERVVTSKVPGTTRDAVDVETEEFIFIDTAGLRKKYPDDLAYYSSLRSMRSLRYADVTIVVIDVSEPITRMDKKIINLVEEEGKGIVIALNKVDLVPSKERKMLFPEISSELHFVDYAPKIFTSAKTWEGIHYLLELVKRVHEESGKEVSQEELLLLLQNLAEINPPPVPILNFSQRKTRPPTFKIVTKQEISDSYLKFLERRLRAKFGFVGQPIRFIVSEKKK